MNEEQKQRAAQMLRRFSQANPRTLSADTAAVDMAALLQEMVDAPEPEPFGYFKDEPFGWTDCSETDEGAIALYAAPPAKNQSEQHIEMVNAPAPSVPDVCDGKEQDAFIAWANDERYDMSCHPLHFLFLNERTNAARQGWKAAIRYCRESMLAAAPEAPAVQETWHAEQCAQVLRALRYIQGIAERGEGRPMRDNESLEEFLLGYVQRLERKAPAVQADLVKDAERYRWLKCERFDKPYAVTNENMIAVYEGEELDSAIDAAIAAEKGGA